MITTVDQLRAFIAEPSTSAQWTDVRLQEYLDAYETPQIAAHYIWLEKAATYSKLVDVSEGSSSRKMGDLYDNAMAQARYYLAWVPAASQPVATDAPRTRAIRRA